MIAAWLGASFAIWLAGGLAVWKALPPLKAKIESHGRSLRAIAGLALLLVSGALLIGGLLLVSTEYPRIEDLGVAEMAVVTIGGLAFVLLQCVTAMILLSLAVPSVTIAGPNSSIKQNSEGIDS